MSGKRRRFDDVDVVVSDVNNFNFLILNLLTTIKKKIFNRPCVMVPQVDEPFSRKSWPGPPQYLCSFYSPKRENYQCCSRFLAAILSLLVSGKYLK